MDEFITEKELRDSLKTETQRISEIFRFVLKYQRHFQPSGVEFSGLREYLPSDDASRIDWKNSAASQDLYVKQYEEEISLDVFIIIDVSDTMKFGTAEKIKSEFTAGIASAIAYASVDVGIDVGFGFWGEEKLMITPRGGEKQFEKLLHEIVKKNQYGGKFNLEDALKDVVGQIKENTSIFIISDFLEVEGEWSSQMTLASNKFRGVTSIMVRDLRDYELPDNGLMKFKSFDGKTRVVNTSKIQEKFEEEASKQEDEIREELEKAGSGFLKIDTRESFAKRLATYFEENTGVS